MSHIRASIICGSLALLAGLSFAQQQPAGRILNIPPTQGVYFDSPSGMVNVPSSVLMPFRSYGVRDLLGLGSSKGVAQIDGAGAALEVGTSRPTFLMRGYRTGTKLYLVKTVEKQDYRAIRMSHKRDFAEWGEFEKADLHAVHMEPVADNLVSVSPRADLPAGEYVLVATMGPQYRAIRMIYEFSVGGTQ